MVQDMRKVSINH